ncbi:MAG: isocitrate/isopropylmalate family dehydrogenase, partial [Candidatus Poseidoniaceae archaeon]|nr:isocitrate/isopropylmalate family dehydrogenase [Candidatus Poseidoniaceae archaeon]
MSATTTTMTMTMTMGKPCVRARAKATRATRASGRRSVAVNASKKYNITILPGDGIGPEIMKVATAALEVAGKKADVEFAFTEALVGGSAIDA